ncbi:TetR/AcrR family transcriptional regulator [Gordonia malaquae]|uniref:TetR/AcrR family transcriptional regulator n=1 Tax=Gordonia malaquae TaxID=410332 RepID=UPI0030C7A043
MTRPAAVRDYAGVTADDRRNERRTRLLAVGRTAWGRAGIGDISIRGVCRDAELAARYFYENFDNRDAYLVAIADGVREQMVATMVQSSSETGGSIGRRLHAALTAFLRAVADDPEAFRIMTTDVSSVPGLEHRRNETLDLVADIVLAHFVEIAGEPDGRAVDDAELRPAARFVVGGVNRLIEAWIVERDVSIDDLAATCTRLALRLTEPAK